MIFSPKPLEANVIETKMDQGVAIRLHIKSFHFHFFTKKTNKLQNKTETKTGYSLQNKMYSISMPYKCNEQFLHFEMIN